MPTRVQVDTMMIQEGLLLPTSLGLESDSYSNGWRVLKDIDSYSLDRRVRALGWHLFFMAEQVKVIVLGRREEKNLRRGLKRIMAKVRSLNFNCVGLTEIVTRHFLGIPYVAITAHSYHLQESCVIQSAGERRRVKDTEQDRK